MPRQVWTESLVMERIRDLRERQEPLAHGHVAAAHPRLLYAAERYFGSWGVCDIGNRRHTGWQPSMPLSSGSANPSPSRIAWLASSPAIPRRLLFGWNELRVISVAHSFATTALEANSEPTSKTVNTITIL